jgi:hypothetical protein
MANPHDAHRSGEGADEHAATMSVHGHLVVGDDPIYLSHLPMFMFGPERHPHNYQVLLEARLSGPGDPAAAYRADRARSGERVYTLEPEHFSLTDFVSTDPRHPRLVRFQGTVYRGHFEREGRPILKDVTVEIDRVIHFRAFVPGVPPLPQLAYLLFGEGSQLYLAHRITRPPDFDQVLAVAVSGATFDAAALRRGIPVTFPGRANTIDARLQEGERLEADARLDEGEGLQVQVIEVAVGTEFYYETGDLAEPM